MSSSLDGAGASHHAPIQLAVIQAPPGRAAAPRRGRTHLKHLMDGLTETVEVVLDQTYEQQQESNKFSTTTTLIEQ